MICTSTIQEALPTHLMEPLGSAQPGTVLLPPSQCCHPNTMLQQAQPDQLFSAVLKGGVSAHGSSSLCQSPPALQVSSVVSKLFFLLAVLGFPWLWEL